VSDAQVVAKTGDSRVGTALQQRLTGPPKTWPSCWRCAPPPSRPTPPCTPLLLHLSQDWAGDDDEFMPLLAFATSRCRPEAKAQALKVERELVAIVNSLLAAQGLTPTTVGDYPRTALTFHRLEDSTPLIVFDAIWSDEDPWDYPLEQMARSFVFSYVNDTEDY
jgi:hypothetical protein